MVASATCLALTSFMNSENVSSLSLGPWPLLTTAINKPATAIKTTHNIKCLIFEFTKPPGPYLYRRRSRQTDSKFRSRPSRFPNPQRPRAAGGRGETHCHAKVSGPHDHGSVRHNRPMTALPSGNPRFLEEGFDLFLAGTAFGLILVTGPPVPEFQRTGRNPPVYPTGVTIIYGIRGIQSFRVFNQFQGKREIGTRHPHHARHGSGQAVPSGCLPAGAGTCETKPIQGSLDLRARRLRTSVAERGG